MLILVIGGTGAQGLAVIDALLDHTPDGPPSPFSIRVLTRNVEDRRAQRLAQRPHVELILGSVLDMESVSRALDGAYGVFVNTDSFTIGEKAETLAAFRIFELAKSKRTVKHYVWSGLDYHIKLGKWNPQYRTTHPDTKARVSEWMETQTSEVDGMRWSILTTAPYMDMLFLMFAPAGQRPDGTYVFVAPMGNSQMPMVALCDIGFFARYIFDHPTETSGENLKIASVPVGWSELVETFTRVTGYKAEYMSLTLDAYMDLLDGKDDPLAASAQERTGTTWGQNFSGWWRTWRDELVKRDWDWIRGVHPRVMTLERWMQENNYNGSRSPLLKITELAFPSESKPRYNKSKLERLLAKQS